MHGDSCQLLRRHFAIKSHGVSTRINGYSAVLPKFKLSVNKSSFSYMGDKLYNTLPLKVRKASSMNEFKKHIGCHSFTWK